MTTVIATHEVEDGDRWIQAWNRKPGSRHDLMASIGATARVFRSPVNPNLTGIIFEVADLSKFNALLQSDEGKKAMKEDGVKVETLHIAYETNI